MSDNVLIDICSNVGTASIVNHASPSGSADNSGVIENINDGDDGTFYSYRRTRSSNIGGNLAEISTYFTVVWPLPYTVLRTRSVWTTRATGSPIWHQVARQEALQLRIDGSWVNVQGVVNRDSPWARTTILNGNWENVTGIRQWLRARAQTGLFYGASATGTVWSLEAFTKKVTQLPALKIKGRHGIYMAGEKYFPEPAESPLKVMNKDEVKNVHLVEITDPVASPIRVVVNDQDNLGDTKIMAIADGTNGFEV